MEINPFPKKGTKLNFLRPKLELFKVHLNHSLYLIIEEIENLIFKFGVLSRVIDKNKKVIRLSNIFLVNANLVVVGNKLGDRNVMFIFDTFNKFTQIMHYKREPIT